MPTHMRKAYASRGDDATLSRWVKIPVEDRKPKKFQPRLPGLANPSIEAGRSIFHRKGVVAPGPKPIFVSGINNVKIGRDVRKGHLRGYWIYTLSLEERATCPRSCTHWQDCYGNNMPWAKRVDHRDQGALFEAIRRDIDRLVNVRGRIGILVRLHALGDFYSIEYVRLWNDLLNQYPTLACYGYTARNPNSDIGLAIARLKDIHGRRFAIRWSDGGLDRDCTVSIRSSDACPPDAFVCPEQTGKTVACATCGACWTGDRNVAFMDH